MSWGVSLSVENGKIEVVGLPSNVEVEHHKDQFTVAKRVVRSLVKSGTFGDPEGAYDVVISAHGNPDHKPTPGWSNDFINISLSQRVEVTS